jgi:hypothetical protein
MRLSKESSIQTIHQPDFRFSFRLDFRLLDINRHLLRYKMKRMMWGMQTRTITENGIDDEDLGSDSYHPRL